jgi:hypothetical protein
MSSVWTLFMKISVRHLDTKLQISLLHTLSPPIAALTMLQNVQAV